jgi:cardiolipin synthase
MVGVFAFFYLVMELFSFWKFKKHASLHLYSSKVGGYIQGSFFFLLFACQFIPWMFYLSMVWGVLSYIEVIFRTVTLKQPTSNAKGLYWLRKAQKD